MSILNHIDTQIVATAARIAQNKDELESLKELLNLLKGQKQKYCPHNNTYTKDSLDYHNNVEWVETHCADCGKYLHRV